MNETSLTRFKTIGRIFGFFMVFFFGSITPNIAQTECGCKGAIQVSVDDSCEAEITSDMLLANSTTCGGASTAIVTLMKTPTGGVISTGTGSADLIDGKAYIGKTIYGKVTEASGINSCWATIKIEDKLAPVIECPDDMTLTCYQMLNYCPIVTENCSHYTLNIIEETVTVNDCKPATGLAEDVLKVVTRTYQAVDESGNKSVPCTMSITVVGLPTLDEPYVNMPSNKWLADQSELQCNEDYSKIPSGTYAGHPSPTSIGGKKSTGVPHLLLWDATSTGRGIVDGDAPGSVTLDGGTDTSLPNTRVVGSQICYTSGADQTLTFNWSAFMINNAGSSAGGMFTNDEPAYSVNGTDTFLPAVLSANTGSGTTSVSILKGDVFCLKVYTMNRLYHTVLTVSNLTSSVPAAAPKFYLPAYPTPDLYCNILVSFTDVELPKIGCVTKIMRTWQVLEWSCRTTQRVTTHLQMIEIVDKIGPAITCPADYTVSTNGHSCEATVVFPAAVVTDNCSNEITVDITYPDGFIKSVNGGFGSLPVGCHTVTYTAYDACYNSTTCSMVVTVEDNTPPVAICDQFTTIGLTSDGKAWVPASSFDDGSYDECELAKMLVRRMDASACTPCKTPEFPGFTYLGDFGPDGSKHYYYISKHQTTPNVAIKTAVAMGGYVTAINTATEGSWLYEKVQEWHLGGDYLIGLRDVKQKGVFSWLSGETSTYRNWASGSPQDVLDGHNDFDYVKVQDADGKWLDFGSVSCDEESLYYVVEITDPCGFSSYAQFCCSDIGTDQMVQFRVIDKAGNWNDCMVSATVQDKLPPSISCPAHMTVTCNDYFDLAKLTHTFGWPTVFDNCENPKITTDSIIEMNSCRIGKITRNFTATDAGGRTATCTQIIIVNGQDNPFEMALNRWPEDVTIEGCEDPNDAIFAPENTGKPNLTADNICTLVGSEYEDQIFTFNNDNGEACFKILRHWTVIDWCQKYAVSSGYEYRTWTHTQVIKVTDPVKPVITSNCDRKSVCTYDPTCEKGYIELIASATDVCTEVLKWSYKIDANNDGSFESGLSKSGLGNTVDASGNYPIGSHKIVWAFEDRCGNVTKCEQLFDIFNCKAPTPYCLNGLATSLMPMDTDNDGIADSGMIELWASDFDNGSYHPCGYPVLLSFEPVTLTANGSPVIVSNRTFTCDDAGKNVDVKLYAAVVTPMGTVVQDYCLTFVSIQDNNNVCDGDDGRLTLNGTLTTESEVPVKEVNVKLEGSEMNILTGNDGTFAFGGMLTGGTYVVRPLKNDDHLNGVSTLDLVMIQRHILGLNELDSPYKLIAADVNKDQKITAADLTELRKLILGVVNEFSNNQSWRFIEKTYEFQDAQNAHAESFPEVNYVSSMNTNVIADFTSIKVGDVNGNVIANASGNIAESRTAKTFELEAQNQSFTAGQKVEIPVTISGNSEVTGFQFTVNFDTELFSLEAVNGALLGMTDNNFGFARLADGALTVSYNKESALDFVDGDKVFTLVLKAKDKGLISQGLWIDSAVTTAEAYTQDNAVMNVAFNVNGRTNDQVVLYQNTPNPFKSNTVIGFDLPKAMSAVVTVYDVTGKTLKVVNNQFMKGYNSIEINKNELGSAGVLYYTLEAEGFSATRKLVVIE